MEMTGRLIGVKPSPQLILIHLMYNPSSDSRQGCYCDHGQERNDRRDLIIIYYNVYCCWVILRPVHCHVY